MKSALIVDDQEAVGRTLKRHLEMDGFDVQTVGNGIDALALLKARAYSVVFLDLMLPDMTGLALLAKLKSDNSAARIIAMSGDDTLLQEASSSSDAVLSKPLKSVEIEKALENAGLIT
ncbi:MAG TPA: response regulator [Acidobacteriota bacterium]|nr:response regulator [Acidobacteriota bacterium]